MVINYFKFIAEETRNILASLGYKKLSDIIGQTSILDIKKFETGKLRNLVIDPIISDANVDKDIAHMCEVKNNELIIFYLTHMSNILINIGVRYYWIYY